MALSNIVPFSSLDSGLILAPERYDPRRRITNGSAFRLRDIVEIVNQSVDPQRYPQPVILDTTHVVKGFVRISSLDAQRASLKSSKKLLKAGDVIISRLRPYLRQVAYITRSLFGPEETTTSVLCSTEFFVLRSKSPESIAFLVPFLLAPRQQEVLCASQEGGHHPRFNASTLLELPIDADIMERREALSREVETLSEHLKEIEGTFERLVGNLSL